MNISSYRIRKWCKEGIPANRSNSVPKALQSWFLIHFVVDVALAIPLMLVPERFLEMLRWQSIDPVAARLVAAALFGIGISSYLSHRASLDTYTHLLKLKIIWSFSAISGLLLSLGAGNHGRPWVLWLILVVFMIFNGVWIYWYRRVDRMKKKELPD